MVTICYYTAPKYSLTASDLCPMSMASSPMPSGPIKGMHWSDLVLNKELHLKTEEQNILYTFGQCWLIMSCNSLITSLPESSTCSTCYLQIDDDLVADHEAAGRLSSTKTYSRSAWRRRMFQRSEI